MEENILPDEELSPEDLAARKKGLALVARIEQLMQTDEGFRDWFQEGIDQRYYVEAHDVGLNWLREQQKKGNFTGGIHLINRRGWFDE